MKKIKLKKKWGIRRGLGLLLLSFLVLMCANIAGAEIVNAFNGAYTGTNPIWKDQQSWAYSNLVDGQKLPLGSKVQLIKRTGSIILPPAADGTPGEGAEALLDTTTIAGEAGKFFSTGTAAPEDWVYIRVWDQPAVGPGAYYDNSNAFKVYQTLQDVEWFINQDIKTKNVIAHPINISPGELGQGAGATPLEKISLTISGQYLQKNAVITFYFDSNENGAIDEGDIAGVGLSHNNSDNEYNGDPAGNSLDCDSITIKLGLAQNTSVGQWLITVKNPNAIESNPIPFQVNAGPHFLLSPSQKYRGDKDFTVNLNAANYQGTAGNFQNGMTIDFSGSGIDYTESQEPLEKTPILRTLKSFSIDPDALPIDAPPLGRTVRLTNPDQGTDTKTFTVSDPSLSNVVPNKMYRGNIFEDNEQLTLNGLNTHFAQGDDPVVSFAPSSGLIAEEESAQQDNIIKFTLKTAPNTPPGPKAIGVIVPNIVGTKAEEKTKISAFEIVAPSINLNMDSAYQGDILNMVIEANQVQGAVGSPTHFKQGVTDVTINDTRISIDNITVNNLTSVSFLLTIPPGILPENESVDKTITVTTDPIEPAGGVETITHSFTIKPPFLHDITPSSGNRGEIKNIEIKGTGTHFKLGSHMQGGDTDVSFGDQITVNYPINVGGHGTLNAEIDIAEDFAGNSQNVTITTKNVALNKETGVMESEIVTGVSLSISDPTAPPGITDLRALSEPETGQITLKWSHPMIDVDPLPPDPDTGDDHIDLQPDPQYSGARILYSDNFEDWDNLKFDSKTSPVDLIGNIEEKNVNLGEGDVDPENPDGTTSIITLPTDDTYYFKVFSYVISGDQAFTDKDGLKVAGLPMQQGVAPKELTFVPKINSFSLPFGPDQDGNWYAIDNTENINIQTAFDLVKAINEAAVAANGTKDTVTSFGWLEDNQAIGGAMIAYDGEGNLIASPNLTAHILKQGNGYQVFIGGANPPASFILNIGNKIPTPE